ncbi:hypothetical protein [Aeromonas sp. sif2433]|uniref:hypothetical protein n=1 Tax=Aeromonas sp. sif2433 TaxID=2854794 RepID=UPI001C4449D0|nr:hypothetical protein [Aeromonas sp. sif2433]MBV7416358.1 hypothetical protein [Aeromonas sp. sif2433]
MKTLIAVLMLSTLSLNVMANEIPRPELDTVKLGQEMLAQQQAASYAVVQEALGNLKPLALDTLVVGASSADETHPES